MSLQIWNQDPPITTAEEPGLSILINMQGLATLHWPTPPTPIQLDQYHFCLFTAHLPAHALQPGQPHHHAILIHYPWHTIPQPLRTDLHTALTANPIPKPLTINLSMHRIVDVLRSPPLQSPATTLYHSGVRLALIAWAIELYLQTQRPQPRYITSDYDRERIIFARDYIMDRLHMPPTLPELARIAGINEFKLKRGFKEIFHTGIHAYLSEARLLLAHDQLQRAQKTATEIAFELGYASPQHFSAAFKKRFGIPPKHLNP